jgi:hypothetical protein
MSRTSALAAALAAALAVSLPALAPAQTIDATAMTLLAGRQDPRDGTVHTVVPAYEDVWISARDLGIPGVDAAQIVVSGWGMVAGGDPIDGDNLAGDLDLAFIEGKLFGRHLTVRAGRQLVSSGVARNVQVDGLDLVARGPLDLGLEVYGGLPVVPRFAYGHGQAVVGGRLFWRPALAFEGGVSFVQIFDDALTDRQELGADARVVISSKVTVTGLAAFSVIEERLSEASLRALWQPQRNLELTLEASRISPDLFISRASIFSVFAEETRDEGGATLYFRPLPRVRLWADGFVLNDDSGTGGRGGLRASFMLDGANATQIGVEGRILALPSSRYVQARLFGSHRFPHKITATLDCDSVWLDPQVNGQDLSLTFVGTLGWEFLPSWKAVVVGVTGETPLLEWRVEALAKLVYAFDYHVTRVTP